MQEEGIQGNVCYQKMAKKTKSIYTTAHSYTNSLNLLGLGLQANDRLQMQYKNQSHTIVIGMEANQITTKRFKKFLQNNCSSSINY